MVVVVHLVLQMAAVRIILVVLLVLLMAAILAVLVTFYLLNCTSFVPLRSYVGISCPSYCPRVQVSDDFTYEYRSVELSFAFVYLHSYSDSSLLCSLSWMIMTQFVSMLLLIYAESSLFPVISNYVKEFLLSSPVSKLCICVQYAKFIYYFIMYRSLRYFKVRRA